MNFKNEIIKRNRVTVIGSGSQKLIMAHGFGCDQKMWRFMVPILSKTYTLILFDYVGSGMSDVTQFDNEKYSTLHGYAQDIIDICEAMELKDAILVGHSVSSIIGLLASIERPELFSKLVMVCPSPCFFNIPPDYIGGFEKQDLKELLRLMDKNYIGWANYLAPLVMGVDHSECLINELSDSFCSTDPLIAKTFAKATFLSDFRHILNEAKHPVLICQSQEDALASQGIGEYVNAQLPVSELQIVAAKGHCLHMTHPNDISELIINYVK